MELVSGMLRALCTLMFLLSAVSPLNSLKTSSIARKDSRVQESSSILEYKRRYSRRLKRSDPQTEIKCNQESLMFILDKCESAVMASVGSPASRRRRSSDNSFCGASCSHLVFTYVNICGFQEFIVNVSGACKLPGNDFLVNCIHAAVVVKPGIVSCMNTHQESVSHDVRHLVDTSKTYRQSKCCSLQTDYNSSFPGHDIIYDSEIHDFRVDPPLLPPWKEVDVSEYPPVLDLTRSSLCLEEATTSTPREQTESVGTIGANVTQNTSNSSSQLKNACRSDIMVHLNTCFICVCLVLFLSFFS